ncbi:uncharacterized protein LOC144178020 [Haemaphysalis longicornis]
MGSATSVAQLGCHGIDVLNLFLLQQAQEGPVDKLARCLTQSKAFPRLLFIFLDGFREFLFFCVKLILPGSTDVLGRLFLPPVRGPGHPTLKVNPSSTPKGCSHTINVTVPENLRVKECIRPLSAFCDHWARLDRHMLSSFLLSALVCILQNIPTEAAFQLLKKFMCNLLRTILAHPSYTTAAPLLRPVLNLLRLLLRCEEYNPVSKLAERTLLRK